MSGFLCWNVSIIFLVISSSTPVCESHHSTVACAVPPAAGAAVAPPAAAPPAVGAAPPVGVAVPPHAARSDAPASPAMPCRNLRRLTAGFSAWVPMCVLLQIHLSHSSIEAEMQHRVCGGCASILLWSRITRAERARVMLTGSSSRQRIAQSHQLCQAVVCAYWHECMNIYDSLSR